MQLRLDVAFRETQTADALFDCSGAPASDLLAETHCDGYFIYTMIHHIKAARYISDALVDQNIRTAFWSSPDVRTISRTIRYLPSRKHEPRTSFVQIMWYKIGRAVAPIWSHGMAHKPV